MPNLHKLDISAYNSRFSKEKKGVNHNRRIFLSDFHICMGMPCYNHTFLPKRYSASMQISLISIIYAKTKGDVK